jgi:hypothetical protein
MHRRSFLKLGAALSVGAVMPLGFDWEAVAAAAAAARTVSAGGRLYKFSGRRVYVSRTRGKTWALHSDLGPNCPVRRLTVDRRGRLHASVGYRRWSFGLVLAPDRRTWLTT